MKMLNLGNHVPEQFSGFLYFFSCFFYVIPIDVDVPYVLQIFFLVLSYSMKVLRPRIFESSQIPLEQFLYLGVFKVSEGNSSKAICDVFFLILEISSLTNKQKKKTSPK